MDPTITRQPDPITGLPDTSLCFERMLQEEECKILTPLFLIANPWLRALIYTIPQIPHEKEAQFLRHKPTVFSLPPFED